MTQTFKVGDRVINEVFGAGEIVYGPYDGGTYLCKTEDGTHRTVTGSLCKPAPKIKVGDVVKGRMTGRDIKILAGPFRRGSGSTWYAVEYPGGAQGAEAENSLVAKESADTYVHDGETYDLSATYRDRDGDSLRIKLVDGVPLVAWFGGEPEYGDDTLTQALEMYGPFTRTSD